MRNGFPEDIPLELFTDRLKERFWKFVQKGDGCWEWSGARSERGYGRFSFHDQTGRDITRAAHRIAFLLSGNILSKDELLLHKCDNPPCCRADHLQKGTQLDNMRDMIAKGRKRWDVGENGSGAILTDLNVSEIYSLVRNSDISVGDLSTRFGVSKIAIYTIISGTHWAHREDRLTSVEIEAWKQRHKRDKCGRKPGFTKYPLEVMREVVNARRNGMLLSEIKKRYGASQPAVVRWMKEDFGCVA